MRIGLPSLVLCLSVLAGPAPAQGLDVPFVIPQYDCPTSRVAGLDPNGDGFLAVRSGPGSNYRMLDKVYNGDVVATCSRTGKWFGVLYRGRGTGTGPANRQGWVHSGWLVDLAG